MNDTENRRPYAAAANVAAVLERARSRNLPDTLDGEFLRLAQVPEAAFGRVTFALQFLDLIDGNLRPTQGLRSMAGASDAEYRGMLAACLQSAYRDDFSRVDPGRDTQAQLVDAFRRYEPRSQSDRMVMLFLGLCREARIPVLEPTRERKGLGVKARMAAVSRSPKASVRNPDRNGSRDHGRTSGAVETSSYAGLLFGVTESDIAALDPNEFEAVWKALGKVALARARSKHRAELVSTEAEPIEE